MTIIALSLRLRVYPPTDPRARFPRVLLYALFRLPPAKSSEGEFGSTAKRRPPGVWGNIPRQRKAQMKGCEENMTYFEVVDGAQSSVVALSPSPKNLCFWATTPPSSYVLGKEIGAAAFADHHP
jgi:hypothetical protein